MRGIPERYEDIYVKHWSGIDKAKALRLISDQVVNGRMYFDRVEVCADDTYWVKECGEYEIVIPMPYDGDGMAFDLDGRRSLKFEVRKKQ